MSELEYTEHGWRMTTDTKRHHRTNAWDYTGRGVYHITLVVAERYPLFGELSGDSPDNARIALNPFGKAVLVLLRDEPRFYGEKGYAFQILASQVMPDHIHVAIQVLKPLPKSIGIVIRGFKSACTSLYKNTYATDGRKCAPKGEIEGLDVFLFSRIFTRIGSIWQQERVGYHEHIIHTYGQLDAMIRYIKDNPRRLWLKRANPDLFRIHQQTDVCGVLCTTLGNMFLAENPLRKALHCSRSLTQPEIDTLKSTCLTHAANGTIYISPAIAEGEKQICRALRQAGYPLIIILSEGFPQPDNPHYKYYKPSGVYFEACAAGQLLLIEPDTALFERKDIEEKVYAKTGPIPHNTKRYRFVAQNAIADLIAEQKYTTNH